MIAATIAAMLKRMFANVIHAELPTGEFVSRNSVSWAEGLKLVRLVESV